MPSEVAFPVGLVYRKVGPGAVLAEALFFPELSRLAANREAAALAVRRNLIDRLAEMPPGDLILRRRATSARLHEFTLTLDPPRASDAWRSPVELTFHALVWDHPSGRVLARIAELGVELIADPKAVLDEVLRREALAALRRMNVTAKLKPLVGVQTTTVCASEWVTVKAAIPTLKARAVKAESEEGRNKKTVLAEVTSLMNPDRLDPAFECDEVVRQIADALTAKPPQSVLLVGPSGVGKTAAVRELVRQKAALHLAATPFHQTSGARIVAGQTGFGMWEQRCQELVKEASKKRVVLHVGPLVELMEVGKSECNHTGIAAFLRPAIARGDLLCVAECTPEQIPLVEKQDPQLLDAFRHVTVSEPDATKGKTILANFADENRRRTVDAAGLAAIDRLHRRYATYSAYPGRPIRFLENLIRDGVPQTAITEEEVYASFTRETGLPRPLIDPAVPLDLGATRSWFGSRVIGQPDAVNLVVDLLATVKAGLTRPNRPIASLLFIGPTGVGKTEMAKALAEYLFGSKDRLTRFDMSEFADAVSVRRLVGGAFGSEGLLTAKVREQPFCVLLLDEVEKADASFFDLLLQALGEARLTDAGGRLADFRNAVVILTSNLGAETFRRGTTGFTNAGPGEAEARDHFSRAVEQFLRPEMFNRLDRVVPFGALGPDVVRSITDREWNKVLARDGVRFRSLSVTADPKLLDHLAAVGYDPRYGARPLKRAMERELLAPLARQLNRHSGDTPLSADVTATSVSVRPIQGVRSRDAQRSANSPSGKLATDVQRLRRYHQLVATSSVVRELTNEVYQISREEERIRRKQHLKKKLTPEDQDALVRLGRLRDVADDVVRQREAAFALEDEAVVAFHDGLEPPPALAAQYADAEREWDKLLLRLYALDSPQSDLVTLGLFSEHREHLFDLMAAYVKVAKACKLDMEAVRYILPGAEAERHPPHPLPPPLPARWPGEMLSKLKPPPKHKIARNLPPGDVPSADLTMPETAWLGNRFYLANANPPTELLRRVVEYEAREGTIGFGLMFTGAGAHVRFCGEGGLHVFEKSVSEDPANPNVLVAVSTDTLDDFRPPATVTRRGALKDLPTRRVYHRGDGRISDSHLERTWPNAWVLADALGDVVAANMRTRLVKLIVE